ncbi:MAG: inorganic phosphate transporter [Chthoniobacterales bacterium]
MCFLASDVPSVLTIVFLVLAVGLALSFEFVNGFHDTANAVATVIYTNTLKPTVAVVWSGIWNLIGVLTSSGAVAFGIMALLPVELVINVGSVAGFAMVFALLLSAILWNLGTWYLGLPASSSHTLIGSILGVGLANSMMSHAHTFGEGVNWMKAKEVGLALLISPVVGFCAAALLLLLAKTLIKHPELYKAPEGKQPPPWWIRGTLMLTCTGVSYAHGSNDGQKGMGLIVLILVGILPGMYALQMSTSTQTIQQIRISATTMASDFTKQANGAVEEDATKTLSKYLKGRSPFSESIYPALAQKCKELSNSLHNAQSFKDLTEPQRRSLRTDCVLISGTIKKLGKANLLDPTIKQPSLDFANSLEGLTQYIPDWVKYAVALALGLGTMIGWKRIVVTVGEKIGKQHLSYAQGASAEMVAMATILIADHFGLPVSTTHVLSSGVAGTMVANHGGLQWNTLRNILLAWVLTLPVCIFLGAMFFAFALNVIGLFALK